MRKLRIVTSPMAGILLTALLLGTTTADAQFSNKRFDRFRSGTNFNQNAASDDREDNGRNRDRKSSVESIRKLIKKNKTLTDPEESNENNVFGRGTGIAAVSKGKDSDKYVNLNPETAFGPEVVESFDFPETSLVDLTKHMQKLTGINLILDKDLKGKISIMAPAPITVGDAWKAYLTALNINGYTLVKSGSFYKVVNARDIRYTPTKIYTGNYTPNTENYVMRIIPLKNIDSTEVTRSFRPFMSRYGRIIEIKQTNTIIIQDTGSNINRLVRLIKFLDVPGHEESLQIIPVQHSSAQEIAKLLDQILKGQSSGKSTRGRRASKGAAAASGSENISKIIAEPRTNSIIAMANAEGAKQLRELIKKLDVKRASTSGGQIHVYYLNYGDAEELSKTLSALVSQSQQKTRTSRFSKRNEDDEDELFSSDVKITADKGNNALVVTATPTDYLTIKGVISKLDVPRDQVYVEGMIMETNVDTNSNFGVSYIGAYGTGSAQKAGFTGGNSDLLNLLTNNITSLGGLFVGAGVGKKITQDLGNGQSIEINSVNALVTAIATDSNTNVLATPQILALDNTEAVFEVGETIPTPERTDTANGSSTVSIKPQKVALTLKITPQINKVTRFIKLKIDQKVEDFSERQLPSGVASQGIATNTRSAITTVVVRDRDTIAMGGLMRDKEVARESKVPLLGDIPVLGWLFKNKSRGISKVNLLFFLTPKILGSYEKTAAKNTKDLLNRRSLHLKESFAGEDPFSSTVKGLYDKAKKQDEGPLYDESETRPYIEDGGFSNNNSESAPDYNDIVQRVRQKASALKKYGKVGTINLQPIDISAE